MKRQSGFTIVELLIVIVVIGILAAISVVAYNGIQQRARDSQRQSNIANIAKALEMYYIDNGRYPNFGSQMASISWTKSNLSLPESITIAPRHTPAAGATSFYNGTTSSTLTNQYGYWNRGGTHAAPTACDGTIGCQVFQLYWYSEAKSEWKVVNSQNG